MLPNCIPVDQAVILPLESDKEIAQAACVIRSLRTGLTPAECSSRIRQLMASQRYRLLAVVAAGRVMAVAGFRIVDTLESSRVLTVDEFVCEPGQRGRGYGSLLVEGLKATARDRLCVGVQLVANVADHDAQRFFVRRGFRGRHLILEHELDVEDEPPQPFTRDPW